jgi:hypothetical protein
VRVPCRCGWRSAIAGRPDCGGRLLAEPFPSRGRDEKGRPSEQGRAALFSAIQHPSGTGIVLDSMGMRKLAAWLIARADRVDGVAKKAKRGRRS